MDPFQIRSLIKAGFSSLMPVRDIVPIFLFCIFLGIRMETCRLSVYRENQRIGTKFERKDFLQEIYWVWNTIPPFFIHFSYSGRALRLDKRVSLFWGLPKSVSHPGVTKSDIKKQSGWNWIESVTIQTGFRRKYGFRSASDLQNCAGDYRSSPWRMKSSRFSSDSSPVVSRLASLFLMKKKVGVLSTLKRSARSWFLSTSTWAK